MQINKSIETLINANNSPLKFSQYLISALAIFGIEFGLFLLTGKRLPLAIVFIILNGILLYCYFRLRRQYGHEKYFRCICDAMFLSVLSVSVFLLSYSLFAYKMHIRWYYFGIMMALYCLLMIFDRYIFELLLRKDKYGIKGETYVQGAALAGAGLGNIFARILAATVKIDPIIVIAIVLYILALLFGMGCVHNAIKFIVHKHSLEIQQLCIDMVEGTMSFEDFYDIVLKSPDIETWINYYFCKSRGENVAMVNSASQMIRQGCWQNTIRGRYTLQKDIKNMLMNSFSDVTVIPDKQVSMIYWLALKACPNEIDDREKRQRIEGIILECKDEWSDSKKVRYVKKRVREMLNDVNRIDMIRVSVRLAKGASFNGWKSRLLRCNRTSSSKSCAYYGNVMSKA